MFYSIITRQYSTYRCSLEIKPGTWSTNRTAKNNTKAKH